MHAHAACCSSSTHFLPACIPFPAGPQKLTHMSPCTRVLYTICKLLVVACLYPVGFWLFNMSRTGIWVSMMTPREPCF